MSAKKLKVRDVVEKYIDLACLLSPTTLDGYNKVLKHGFESLLNTDIKKLNNDVVQIAINQESRRVSAKGKVISAKTVKNEWGLIASALKSQCNLSFNVRLPKIKRDIKEYPDPLEVYKAVKGTKIELPCMLALWLSFSISEIFGLMCSDIKGNVIYINRVRIVTNNGQQYKELGKAEMRIRKHVLPDYIMKLIENQKNYQEYKKNGTDTPLIEISREYLTKLYRRVIQENGLDISFHSLRHLNASVMLKLNIANKYAMERGGWKTDTVLKNVYQHTFSDERRKIDTIIDDYFESMMIAVNL